MSATPTTTSNAMNLYTAVIMNSSTDVIRCLELENCNIEMTGGDNESTPFIEAASLYYADNTIAMLLLERGASPFIQNKNGDTALGMAAFWGNLELVEAMLANSGKVPAMSRNVNGYTAHTQARMMSKICTNFEKYNDFREIMTLLKETTAPSSNMDIDGTPEIKPEIKPEIQPEIKPEIKPEIDITDTK